MKRAFQRTQTWPVLLLPKLRKWHLMFALLENEKKSIFFFDFRRKERVKQYLLIQQVQKYGFMSWKAQERDPGGGYINFSPRSFHYTVDFSHLDSEFTPGSWSSEVPYLGSTIKKFGQQSNWKLSGKRKVPINFEKRIKLAPCTRWFFFELFRKKLEFDVRMPAWFISCTAASSIRIFAFECCPDFLIVDPKYGMWEIFWLIWW